MQLSTRAEDFVVDALALRSHIGPVLGPIFADPGVRAAAGRCCSQRRDYLGPAGI